MKLPSACLIALFVLGPVGVVRAAPTGCGEAPEPEESYLARARQARERKDYAKVAEELWSAWCRSSNFFHLVGICEAYLMGKDEAKGRRSA